MHKGIISEELVVSVELGNPKTKLQKGGLACAANLLKLRKINMHESSVLQLASFESETPCICFGTYKTKLFLLCARFIADRIIGKVMLLLEIVKAGGENFFLEVLVSLD